MSDDFIDYEEKRQYDIDENGNVIDYFAPSQGDKYAKIGFNIGVPLSALIVSVIFDSAFLFILENVPAGILIIVFIMSSLLGLTALVFSILAFVRKLNLHRSKAIIGSIAGLFSFAASFVLIILQL